MMNIHDTSVQMFARIWNKSFGGLMICRRPPDSAVLVIREGYVRLDGWCSRAHVSSRMVSRASELVNLLLIQ